MKCLLYIIFIIYVNIIIDFNWKEILRKIDGNSCVRNSIKLWYIFCDIS